MDTIYTFCQTIYNCTYLPLTYLKDNIPILSLPLEVSKLSAPYLVQLAAQQKPVAYLITKEFHYYGLICDADKSGHILIGPIITTPPSEQDIKNIMFESDISLEHKDELIEFYQLIPYFSFHQFCYFLDLFYQEIYHEELDMEVHFGFHTAQEMQPIATFHSISTYETKENEYFHNTYYYEQQYLDYIRNGNTTELKNFLSRDYSLQEGKIANNTLRQTKNILIVATTLATRHAIAGGLDIESAYQLSDIYIQEGEKAQSLEIIYQLQYTMLVDFASRVEQTRIPCDTTSDIYKCIQFIRCHTNQPITVSDVAAHIGKSRSYISRSFKKKLGFQMNEFIMRCKLEEAKTLLSYTNKSISEISNYLCFSSQSHFQTAFKNKYGITPNTFRMQPPTDISSH